MSLLSDTARSASAGASLETLQRHDYSRRLLIIRSILQSTPAELDDEALHPAAAWALLAQLQSKDPALVRTVLACAQVGAWATSTLRVLNGDSGSDIPLWARLGHLNAVAAAGHYRASVDVDVAVPVRAGTVLLPGLGIATIPATSDWASARFVLHDGVAGIHSDGAKFELPSDHRVRTSVWKPIRKIGAQHDVLAIELDLDDIDWYFEPPIEHSLNELDDVETATWQSMLDEAWGLLVTNHGDQAAELAQGMTCIFPLTDLEDLRLNNGTSVDMFGATFATTPKTAHLLADTLIHEFGHSRLNTLMSVADLVDTTDTSPLYAPWRDDPRPPAGYLHGIFSFGAVSSFYGRQAAADKGVERRLSEFEHSLRRQQTCWAANMLIESGRLTESGATFASDVLGDIHEHSIDVSVDTERLAETALIDHRAAWRMHHLRADPSSVTSLVQHFLSGSNISDEHKSVQFVLAPNVDTRGLDVRQILTRLHLRDEHSFKDLASAATTGVEVLKYSLAGDFALVMGDFEHAAHLYSEHLQTEPNCIAALVGSALASPNWSIAHLLHHAEIAHAVRSELVNRAVEVDFVELLTWVDENSLVSTEVSALS